jgi:hypothetical protein
MKLFLALLTVTILLGACKNNLKDAYTEKVKDRIEAAMNNENDKEGEIRKLKKLEPMTPQELKTLLPEMINDFKLEVDKSYCLNNMASGFYRGSDGAGFLLKVIDCAGGNAKSIALYSDADAIKAIGVAPKAVEINSKIIDFMGGKAMVTEYSMNDSYHSTILKYAVGNRLVIQASCVNMDIEQLKGVLKNLKLKV